ncbi:uncharacterized protein LOC144343138 [Saccoglossus kowalevskii]
MVLVLFYSWLASHREEDTDLKIVPRIGGQENYKMNISPCPPTSPSNNSTRRRLSRRQEQQRSMKNTTDHAMSETLFDYASTRKGSSPHTIKSERWMLNGVRSEVADKYRGSNMGRTPPTYFPDIKTPQFKPHPPTSEKGLAYEDSFRNDSETSVPFLPPIDIPRPKRRERPSAARQRRRQPSCPRMPAINRYPGVNRMPVCDTINPESRRRGLILARRPGEVRLVRDHRHDMHARKSTQNTTIVAEEDLYVLDKHMQELAENAAEMERRGHLKKNIWVTDTRQW